MKNRIQFDPNSTPGYALNMTSMTNDVTLSQRSAPTLASNFGLYYQQLLTTGDDTPFISSSPNSGGRINISIAENRLNFPTLRTKMSECTLQTADVEISQYGPDNGLPKLRTAIAKHLSHLLGNIKETFTDDNSNTKQEGYTVLPESIVVTQGVTSALDALAHVLSNSNDVWLTPAPFYVSYTRDLKTRANVDIWPIYPSNTTNNLSILPTISDFELAYNRCLSKNRRVTTVLICNPSNPTGCCYTATTLTNILTWCANRNLSVVVDEIFAATTINNSFTSVLTLPLGSKPNVAVLWGCAKEFGLGGWHLGCVHSTSILLRQALCRVVHLNNASNPIQHQLAGVLEDRAFIKSYRESNLVILNHGIKTVITACTALGFDYVPVSAGLFVFINLNSLMKECSWANERALFRHIFKECNVVMSPGEGSLATPGWFRCCYACAPNGAVVEAFHRIGTVRKENVVVSEEDRIGARVTEDLLKYFNEDAGGGGNKVKL